MLPNIALESPYNAITSSNRVRIHVLAKLDGPREISSILYELLSKRRMSSLLSPTLAYIILSEGV